jgi:endonuclease G, mitochondrial
VTNHHVLPTAQLAAQSEFELDYEHRAQGETKPVQIFRLEPRTFYFSDKKLDFAFVAVEATSAGRAPLEPYAWLPLIREEGKVRVGDPVNVVQHPRGRAKQVCLRNNALVDLPVGDQVDSFLHYEADTEKGSSGSPVFNDLWEVVGLHHTAVPKTNNADELVDETGSVITERDTSRYVWVANEGVRVSRIVAALEAAPLDDSMARIRDEALRVWAEHSDPAAELRTAAETSSAKRHDSALEAADLATPATSARPSAAVGAVTVSATDGTLEVTVPVQIRISVRELSHQSDQDP